MPQRRLCVLRLDAGRRGHRQRRRGLHGDVGSRRQRQRRRGPRTRRPTPSPTPTALTAKRFFPIRSLTASLSGWTSPPLRAPRCATATPLRAGRRRRAERCAATSSLRRNGSRTRRTILPEGDTSEDSSSTRVSPDSSEPSDPSDSSEPAASSGASESGTPSYGGGGIARRR